LALLMVSLLAGPATAGDTTYRNAKGQIVGKKDDAGRILNSKGQLRAREDEQGRVYNDKGRYRGQEDRGTAPVNTKKTTVKN
jgi:hypothetical protein